MGFLMQEVELSSADLFEKLPNRKANWKGAIYRFINEAVIICSSSSSGQLLALS